MKFVTISILVFLLIAAVGGGFALAIFTEAIGKPWASLPNSVTTAPPPTKVRENRVAVDAGARQPHASDTPASNRGLPTIIASAITTPTPVPTLTPTPTPTPTPEPTPTPVPTPTPTPVSTAGLPWVADGIDESERSAARELSTLAETNPPVARVLLERPWVVDGVDGLEQAAIERIEDIGYNLPTLAGEIIELPWLVDGVTQPEPEVVEILWETADRNLVLAKQLIALPWLADGVTQTEAGLLSDLRYISRADVSLAERLTELPWLVDDVTQDEAGVLSNLGYIADDSVPLAERLVALPWLADGLDEVERSIIERLQWTANKDVALANDIASKPWLADTLGKDNVRVVNGLFYIMDEDTALARDIVSMPFLETLEPTDAAVMDALSWLAYADILALREVLEHPTLEDGISDEWAPVVALLDSVNEAAPAFLRPLLDPERVQIQRRAITLPHTGAVDLAIIRTEPGAARSLELLEHSAGSVAEFMGAALPTNYVGLLFGTAVLGYSGGTNYGPYFVILPKYDADDGSDAADYAGHLMAHEVAHYYWRDNPNWLDEGLAELLAAISESKRTGTAVTINYTYCPDADSIALLERLDAAGVIYDYRCNYALGGQFFLELYQTLGDATFRQGLRNLYLTSQVEDYADEFDGSPVGIRQIQDAFQSHNAAVAPVIDKWYHGTAP